MKKTLAAVLAAAMALSTATVAMATDVRGDADFDAGDLLSSGEYTAKMGDTSKYILDNIDMDNGSVISGSELAAAIKNGYLTPSVVVTSNQNKLDGRPSISTGNIYGSGTVEVKKYVWSSTAHAQGFTNVWDEIEGVDVSDMDAKGDEITFICIKADGTLLDSFADVGPGVVVVKKGTTAFNNAMTQLKTYGGGNPVKEVIESDTEDALRLSFKINHTYGTDSVTVKMKIRFTVKKLPKDQDSLELGGKDYKKGDTITSEEMAFKAKYNELSNYYEDMQLTSTEVSNNNVILDGGNLYDAIGSDTFSISFGDDVAVFTAKAAANQKKVNLYWSLDEISEIKDLYPYVDFTFLTFKGNPAPVFQNTGTMYFAADDKDYQVYSWDGEVLEPLTGKFDPTYKVMEVKGIKKLGTYVIADQILEVEEEPEEPDEPAEPVDSAPTTEPDDEGGNPNTGAC